MVSLFPLKFGVSVLYHGSIRVDYLPFAKRVTFINHFLCLSMIFIRCVWVCLRACVF